MVQCLLPVLLCGNNFFLFQDTLQAVDRQNQYGNQSKQQKHFCGIALGSNGVIAGNILGGRCQCGDTLFCGDQLLVIVNQCHLLKRCDLIVSRASSLYDGSILVGYLIKRRKSSVYFAF